MIPRNVLRDGRDGMCVQNRKTSTLKVSMLTKGSSMFLLKNQSYYLSDLVFYLEYCTLSF